MPVSQSGGRHDASEAAQPLRMSRVSVVEGIEHKFNASGNAELFEYSKKILFDGVFTQAELDRDLTVSQSFGYESDDLFFARCEQVLSVGVQHAQRRDFRNQFQDVVQLLGINPDLPSGYPKQAFTERSQVRVRDGEDAANSGAEGAYYEFAVDGFHQQDLWNLRMRKMKAAERHEGLSRFE